MSYPKRSRNVSAELNPALRSGGSGAEGARTPDLVAASHALSQLSYSPSELVISRKVNTCALRVPRRFESEGDLASARDERNGQQEQRSSSPQYAASRSISSLLYELST